ncbi:MAG: ATP-binding protein [Pseudomonadota bacterium]
MFQLGRKTWILLFVYLIGVSGYIYYLYNETQTLINDSINNKLLHAALGTSAILGEHYHDQLVDKHSKSVDEDWDAIERLSGFNDALGLTFVYTVIKRDGKLYLVSSSASEEELKAGDYVRYFDPYPDASQELFDSFGRSEPTWVDYSDRWGDFRAVFVPQRSKDGSVYVAGAEMSLENVNEQLQQDSLQHIGLAALVLLAFSLWFATYVLRVCDNLEQLRIKEQVLKQARDIAEKADRAKTRFLAAMSHEIRTPMYGVIGASELLVETDLNPGQRALLKTLHTSGQALLSLIDDILDMAKIEAGKLELRPRVFDVRTLVAAALDVVRQPLQDKSILLQVQVAADVPLQVKTDAERLRQILLNLLGNGLKFTESGEVTLSVTVSGVAPRQRLTFSVRDTGIGIPAERQDSLFTPFTQLDNLAFQRQKGSGLGLSICKSLVEALGGTLAFTSQEGVGSVFSFSIPVEACQTSDMPVAEPQEVVGFDASFALHYPLDILLVEDNAVNRTIAQAMLQKLGYQPRLAADGLSAVQVCKASIPDVVLMDINMPGMDGLEATRCIRRFAQGQASYIVAFTASAFQNEIESCMTAGANDLLTKPARLRTLTEVLQRAVRHRRELMSTGT